MGFQCENKKILPGGAQEQIWRTIFGTMPPLQPPSGGFEQAPSESDGLAPQIPYI